MKRIVFVFLLFIPSLCFAQFLGLGGQWTVEKYQFTVVSSTPYKALLDNDSPVALAIGSGLEYTTSGPKISGLYVKPVSFWALTNNMENKNTFALKLDAGYNRNLTHGNNGFILSPNLYADWSIFYLSTGYDWNMTHGEGQFYIRLGVGVTLGFLKGLVNNR
jgi:hypothetical protein